jgi:hypothetical protein
MCFRGEIEHGARPFDVEELPHRRLVGDIGVDEADPGRIEHAFEAEQAARVGKLVDDDQTIVRVREKVPRQVAADEPGTPGNDKGHRAQL